MKEKNNFLIKLGDFITNCRYPLLILFIILTVIGILNINNVNINNSIISYLPDNTETKIGIDIMENEFGSFDIVELMVYNVSYDNALYLLDNLNNIENVESILFDESNSYKDDLALYTIQISELDDDQIKEFKTDIANVLENYTYDIYSESFDDATDGITLALILSIIVIVAILLITSKTYFEPIIAFIVFSISIILNMGSNFLLGEISYITRAIAIILQLALSIDYVIIFMNQYMKEINDTKDNLLTIKKTLSKVMPEIFASSLTTISGLMALVFMQLKIGGDIGIVLSKGILCSLLTVILVMPSLLSIFTNIILKMRKKKMVNKTNNLGSFVLKTRKILLPIFLIMVIIAICLIPNYHYVYNTSSSSSIRLSENTIAKNNIEKYFGNNNILVLLAKNTEKDFNKELTLDQSLLSNEKIISVTSIANYKISDDIYLGTEINYLEFSKIFNIDSKTSLKLFQYYANIFEETAHLADIDNYRITIIDLIYFLNDHLEELQLSAEAKFTIINYYTYLKENISLLESDNYSRIILRLDTSIEGTETYDLIAEIRNLSLEYYEDITLVGNSINTQGLENSFTKDNIIITCITILFVAIILFITFKSIPMTLLLILTIEGSILINFGIISLLGKEMFFMAYIVVCAIQMGATIDYAIVLASRYRQLRKKFAKKTSIIKSLEDTLPAILSSGFILLIAGLLIAFVSTSSIISAIGLFLGIGTLISLLATIFVLPAILYALDKLIIKKNKRSL